MHVERADVEKQTFDADTSVAGEVRADTSFAVGTVLKNMGSSVISLMGATGLSFITSWLLARQLGEAIYGQYVFILGIVGIIVPLADLGQGKVITREMAKDKPHAGQFMGTAMVIRVTVLAILLIPALLIILHMEKLEGVRELAVLLLIMTATIASADMFRSTFNAFERMEFDLITRVSEYGMGLSFIIFMSLLGLTLSSAVIGLFAGACVGFLITVTFMFRFISPRTLRFKLSVARTSLVAGLSMGLSTIIVSLYARIDVLVLGILRTNEEVAWFSIAYSLILILASLSFAASSVLYPVFSRLAQGDRETQLTLVRYALRYILIIGTLAAAGVYAMAEKVILFVYGADYAPAIDALRILAFALMLMFPTHLLLNLLLAENRQHWVLGAHVISVTLLLLFDPPLILWLGIEGAALTNVMVESLIFIFYLLIIARGVGRIDIHIVLKPLAAALIGFVLLTVLPLSLVWRVPLALSAYIITAFVFRAVTFDDVIRLRELVRALLPSKRKPI